MLYFLLYPQLPKRHNSLLLKHEKCDANITNSMLFIVTAVIVMDIHILKSCDRFVFIKQYRCEAQKTGEILITFFGQICYSEYYLTLVNKAYPIAHKLLLLLARLINRQDEVFRGFGRRNPYRFYCQCGRH